jgi:V/A-type H+-transporting ATPase subunit E
MATKNTLETGDQKINKICTLLRQDTLEPAKAEAQRMIEEAKRQAEAILETAQRTAEQLRTEARRAIEKERAVFHSALSQATQQSLEALRQAIEKRLFNEELHSLILRQTNDPQIIAKLITAIVHAIDKEGFSGDIHAYISKDVSAEAVCRQLTAQILNKLKDNSVALGDFFGGVKVRLEGKKMTLDISNAEIEDLLRRYVRKDFRELLFGK